MLNYSEDLSLLKLCIKPSFRELLIWQNLNFGWESIKYVKMPHKTFVCGKKNLQTLFRVVGISNGAWKGYIIDIMKYFFNLHAVYIMIDYRSLHHSREKIRPGMDIIPGNF